MKRFPIYLLALCLLVCLAFFQAPQAQAATHSHCVCGGDANGIGDHVCADSVTWQPWDGTTTLKNGGHYYLNDTDGDGVITLSLLRSPTYPNPDADQGEIPFTYALMPHEGRLQDTDVVQHAYYLNYPMTATRATGSKDILPLSYSPIRISHNNVICETVKESEAGDGTVLRLYECQNRRTNATLTLGLPATRVLLCDMLERTVGELQLHGNQVTLPFKGFEIITIKVIS